MRFISELVSAGRAEAGSGIVHHSALLTADAGHLSGNSVLRRRLTVVRRLSHRLTVLHRLTHRRLPVRLLHWLTVWLLHWLSVRRLIEIRVAVLERLLGEIRACHSDYQTDKSEEETAAVPRTEVLIALCFHNVANNEAPYSCGNSNTDN